MTSMKLKKAIAAQFAGVVKTQINLTFNTKRIRTLATLQVSAQTTC